MGQTTGLTVSSSAMLVESIQKDATTETIAPINWNSFWKWAHDEGQWLGRPHSDTSPVFFLFWWLTKRSSSSTTGSQAKTPVTDSSPSASSPNYKSIRSTVSISGRKKKLTVTTQEDLQSAYDGSSLGQCPMLTDPGTCCSRPGRRPTGCSRRHGHWLNGGPQAAVASTIHPLQ